jgi:hypothetical protein
MSELRKTYEGGLFYFTHTFVGWVDVFNRNYIQINWYATYAIAKKQRFADLCLRNYAHLESPIKY